MGENDEEVDATVLVSNFLSTEAAARMSVLSKRWKHLLKSILSLVFDEEDFFERSQFLNFVEGALSCETLVEFHLEMLHNFRFPALVCLPNLKVLTLEYVGFGDDNSFEKLLACPSLEELSLKNCRGRQIKPYPIEVGHQSDILRLYSASGHAQPKSLSEESCVCYGNYLGLIEDSEIDGWTLDPVPQCFLSSVKDIRICNFTAVDFELLVVRVLLRTAEVLEKLFIHCSQGYRKNFRGNLRKHLMKLPRASDRCAISLEFREKCRACSREFDLFGSSY
ncbi:hypothetical protein NL676_007457 [Syzygium grande]|nr:hypothetical protein NL676_007457 [Syzygium grande]